MLSDFTSTVLTIAGSDPYGGAGMQVDSKVIHTFGGYAFSVITALTAQNSTGVKEVLPTPAEHFKIQLHSILDDIEVDAVKIGMLANAEIIAIISETIDKYKLKNIVLDTVMLSSSGKRLLQEDAVETMIKELFPRVDLITPNIPEVNALLHRHYKGDVEEIKMMGEGLFDLGANAVLIKGGHSTNKEKAIDYFMENKNSIKEYATPRVSTTHTHGTGCVLSSAIATSLAKNENLERSVQLAKDFLYQKLHTASDIKFKYHTENDIRKEPLI